MSIQPFDDRDGYIWFNGELLPWRDAKLHVLTHALHYASSVFEGERIYNGKIFKLEEHTDRLFYSAETLDMEMPYDRNTVNEACLEAMRANDITNGYVRPIAWRGSDLMGVTARGARVNVAIAVWPWPSYFSPEARLKGLKLDLAEWRRPSPATSPVFAKAAGLYMICTLSKHAAERKGLDDALLLDWRGQVAEATGANIFFVMDGKLHTPTPDCFLDGITRRTVMGLAEQHGYEVIERAIMPEEMANADECFLTGTAAEVTPVGSIGSYTFQPGQVCKTLMDAYDITVGKTAASETSAA
ncbi:MAG: branched-chain amino acid aminotransferase [Rhodospirillaceae bacterium]|jgi:branched-chain amino acid aminotransferase|nr:branched-chain amino acid aminotransferase [Rhodospirillaceae bacterium]MBT5241135.1 branched-chain amino acid aminotransferase [Rhodospirillaceae bacterium]MBT5565647.1 branched-chain amino acid aminotransferase [Rhodospirillaceae bacterium]MBT6090853.1 branched-chain amino acid aminotransferase [Rhodospirillaceae bacterium]